MELFFDLIFKPKEAIAKANLVSLLIIPILWLLLIPIYLKFTMNFELFQTTLEGVKYLGLLCLGTGGYILGIASLYSIVLNFRKQLFYSLVLSYFPYIFLFLFSFFDGALFWAFLALSAWSFFLEVLIIRSEKLNWHRIFLCFSPFKVMRILFFLWIIY